MKGFTLVELLIVIVIIGILTFAFATMPDVCSVQDEGTIKSESSNSQV